MIMNPAKNPVTSFRLPPVTKAQLFMLMKKYNETRAAMVIRLVSMEATRTFGDDVDWLKVVETMASEDDDEPTQA